MEAQLHLARAFSRCSLVSPALSSSSRSSSSSIGGGGGRLVVAQRWQQQRPRQPLLSVQAGRRHKSTTSRTKRALNIAPHPSFLPSSTSSSGSSSSNNGITSSIVFNPPASAPTVLHTPFKFLPKTDPRRRRNLSALFEKSTTLAFDTTSGAATEIGGRVVATAAGAAAIVAGPSSSQSLKTTKNGEEGGTRQQADESEAGLPPRVEHEYYTAQKKHLRPEDVEEMRQLRAQDPVGWSVHKLAHRYDCSPIFVMMVVRASREHREQARARDEQARARWGPIRAKARDDRRKRRTMMFRGEI